MDRKIILITIDCLRPDHLGCYGYSRNTSPNIDNISENGIRFLSAIANGPGTSESFKSILASIYPNMFSPLNYSMRKYRSLPKELPTLSQVLRREGFLTAAFSTNPFLTVPRGYLKGFDHTFDFLNYAKRGDETRSAGGAPLLGDRLSSIPLLKPLVKVKKSRLWQLLRPFYYLLVVRTSPRESDILTKEVITWIEEHGTEDFFLWTHYMDPHDPLSPPSDSLRRFSSSLDRFSIRALWAKLSLPGGMSADDRKQIVDLYDAAIRHADDCIGGILSKLKEEGIYDETTIIITADHGRMLGKRGKYAHGLLYDDVIRVPLIIRSPGLNDTTVVEDQLGLIDLPCIILNLTNVDKPESFMGKNLLPQPDQSTMGKQKVITEKMRTPADADTFKRAIAIRTKKWKYIFNEIENYQELYDLKADPEETRNICNDEVGVVEKFKSQVERHVQMEKRTSRTIRKTKRKIRKLKTLKPLGEA